MKSILAIAALVLSMNAMAYTEQEESYITMCGSREALKELYNVEGPIKTSDLKELIDQRAPILNVLKKGSKGIAEVLEQGSKDDIGGFGVVIVCGSINYLKNEIAANGCYDLKTNKPVRDNGGIAACSAVMEKIEKPSK